MESVRGLLWEHPLREITVKMIMEGTDLSRPSFYIHFNSVPALIAETLAALEPVLVEATLPWLASESQSSEELRPALARLLDLVAEDGAVFRACSEAATLDSDLAAAWEAFMGRWDVAVANRIRVGQAGGYMSAEIDVEATAFALNRMNSNMLIHAFGQRPQQDPERVLETIFRIWKRTLY